MYQRTFNMTFNNKPYKVIQNNQDNMVDAFKLRIKTMEWQFSEYQLQGWSFDFNSGLPMTCIARTIHNEKVIEFNTNNLYILTWEMVKYVMLHEIAHALTPNAENHNKVWQDKCKEMQIPATVKLGMKDFKKVGDDTYQILLSHPRPKNIHRDDDFPDLPW